LRPRVEMRERLRELPKMLRNDVHFRWFLIARTCAIAGRVAAPFYIVYASTAVSMGGNTIGTLSFAYLIADTVMNLLWGYMADKIGFRSCFIAALVLWIAATLLLMDAHTMSILFVAFFGLGAGNSGYQMSAQNIVFEFGSREDMAMRLAISNTAEGTMAALGPLLGGFIAAALGYRAVFVASAVFQAVALVLLLRFVEEPRKRRAALMQEEQAALAATSTTSLAQREAEEGAL
jgi:MFS family permease